MFGDWQWLNIRERIQRANLQKWLDNCERPVIMELGAGSNIPTVRVFGHSTDAPMIRINLRESQIHRPRDVGLECGALEGVLGIAEGLGMI